jgi:hypothetical protein
MRFYSVAASKKLPSVCSTDHGGDERRIGHMLLIGRTKNNRDTSMRPTDTARRKQANQIGVGIGVEKCTVGSAISVLSSASAPLPCRR